MKRVLVNRGASYADISDNSEVFAKLMKALGIQPPPGMGDVEFHCISNICGKLARSTASRTHEDNWVDMANYAILQLADLRRTADMLHEEAMARENASQAYVDRQGGTGL